MTGPDGVLRRWREAVAGRPDPAAIVRRPAGLDELPLSAAQARWWYVTAADPNHPSFNLFRTHRLRGPLDTDALARAFAVVVGRHESLRIRIARRGDLPVQVVGDGGGIALERLDLGDLAPDDREARARELVVGWTDARFDVTEGPLVRAHLLRLADDEHVLCLVTHHLIADGLSLDLLVNELRAGYAAFVTDTAAALPELPVGFGDFALWQWSRSDLLEASLRYWLDRLADPPVLDLPTDFPRPAVKQGAKAYVERIADGQLADAVEGLARANRCTPLMVLIAAYQVLLARHAGQDDVCVLSSLSGRSWVEVEPLIGNFASFPILRGDVSGDPTFRELLVRTRTAVLGAYAHPDRPSERLLAELNLPADPSRLPLYQTMLTLHVQPPVDGTGSDGPSWEPFHASYPQIFFDLTVDVWRRPTELSLVFRYDGALFSAATVEALARRFELLLRAVVADPDARLSGLPPIDAEEHERLRAFGEGPAAPEPPGGVLALVEAAAARTPDAVAIDWPGGEPVTYAALWAEVDRRADRLRASGGGRVAASNARTPELVIGPLAAWRAGVERESHRALAGALRALRSVLGGDPADRWLAATPPTCDVAAVELFLPLLDGGRVVIAPREALDDPAALARLAGERGVTHLQATPSHWRRLLDAGLAGPGLTGIVGGEPLPPALARRLHAALGRAFVGYRCLGTPLWSTSGELSGDETGAMIGRPLAGVRLSVRDAWGEPVPVGVAGELWAGGACGPDQVATGDRVRWLADGTLQYLGRIGDQVTISLCRVAPMEVEHRIAEHPAVADVAVTIRPGDDGRPALVAYVRLSTPIAFSQLHADLVATLPAPMLPAHLRDLDELSSWQVFQPAP